MRGDHQLDVSSHEPSNSSTSRPGRGRSRSPKQLRGDKLESHVSFPHDGRGKRRKSNSQKAIEDRGRSGNRASDANSQGSQTRPHKRRKSKGDGPETKGLSDKIHSLRRLLEKVTDMPADVRQEKERELQGYLADQRRHQARREKNAVTSRYHFVRFMERKKADRRLKQLEKKLDEAMTSTGTAPVPGVATAPHDGRAGSDGGVILNAVDDGSTSPSGAQRLALQQEHLKRQVHEARVDLNYTLYAPLHQKYISLYPGGPKKGHGQSTNEQRKAGQSHDVSTIDVEAGLFRNTSGQKPPLWHEVEKAMKNDTLEALRDGKVFQAESNVLTFRSIGEPVEGDGVPDLQSDTLGEHRDMDSEEDFFER